MINFTIKNMPKELHKELKKQAEAHHRSLNGEIIVRLENTVGHQRIGPEEFLERARALREKFKVNATPEEIDRFKREGRQ